MSQRRSDIKEQWITDFKAPGPKTGLHCELNRNKQQESKFKERDDKVSMSIHITDSQSHVPAKPGHWQHPSHHEGNTPCITFPIGSNVGPLGDVNESLVVLRINVEIGCNWKLQMASRSAHAVHVLSANHLLQPPVWEEQSDAGDVAPQ